MIDVSVTTRNPVIDISMSGTNRDINIGASGITNIPKINDIPLIGNKTLTELLTKGLVIDGMDASWVTEEE